MNDEPEIQRKVAIYLRVSTEEQVEKYGIGAQRNAVDSAYKSKGKLESGEDAYVLAGDQYIYIDEGVSGTTEMDERPAFARLKEDILNSSPETRPFDTVVVYKIDRFARNLGILIEIIKFLKEHKIEFLSATESIDTATPFGRAMLGIMGVISELEWETIKERTTKGKLEATNKGVWMGKSAPYGYQKDDFGRLVINDVEADIVRDIYRLFITDNLSPQQIANHLHDKGILSPDASAIHSKKHRGQTLKTNNPTFWRAEKIKFILSYELYTGDYYYGKNANHERLPKSQWKLSEYKYPPIITHGLLKLAQNKLADTKYQKPIPVDPNQHFYLLSGLLKCDFCMKVNNSDSNDSFSWSGGRDKVGTKTKHFTYNYHCNRKNRHKYDTICTVLPIPAMDIDNYITDFVLRLLRNPKAVYDYQKNRKSSQLYISKLRNDQAHYQRLVENIPKRLEAILKQNELGFLTLDALKSKRDELKADKIRITAKLAELDAKLTQDELAQGYIISLDLFKEQYANKLELIKNDKELLYSIIHTLIKKITVYSRPKSSEDIIAGRKTSGQRIPNAIEIQLKLPRILIHELVSTRFLVNNSIL